MVSDEFFGMAKAKELHLMSPLLQFRRAYLHGLIARDVRTQHSGQRSSK